MNEVESIVEQLNDTSTQPTSATRDTTAATSTIKKLTGDINAVEKQLHAAIGAKHKASVTTDGKDRTP